MASPQTAPRWLFLLICVMTVLVYRPGLPGDYMFDDRPNLLDNQALEMPRLDLDSLSRAAWSAKSGELRRPVSMASFALNRYFFGVAPYSYKVVNLIIHLLTGTLLWLVGARLLRNYRLRHEPELAPAIEHWLPVMLAGLWLLHPLNLSTVLYIVQRMTGLAALFSVAGMLLYLHGRERMLAGRHGLGWILAGLLGCGTLALLSKESGVLLPLYLLVIEATLFRFRTATGRPQYAIRAVFIVLVILPGLLALGYLLFHAERYLNYSGRDFTLYERVLTEPRVLLLYLKLVFAPTVQELGLYHDDLAVSHGLLDPPATLAAMLAVAGLLVAGLALLRRAPLVSLGMLWFLAGHALESSIIPLEIAHEHRNYLADYGVLLATAGLLLKLPLPHSTARLAMALPLLIAALFGYTTWVRSGQWSDNVDQAVYEALHHPHSARAVFSAGRIHARLALSGRTESIEPAFDYLQQASRIDAIGIMPDVTLIKSAGLLKLPLQQQWVDTVLRKLASHPPTPSDITSLKELAECSIETCRLTPEQLDLMFTTALRTDNPLLMTIYGFYSINNRGDFDKGLQLFSRVTELEQGEPQYWKNLVNLLIVMQRFDDAEQRLHEFEAHRLVGATQADYTALQGEIDRLRQERHAGSTEAPTRQSGS